MFKPLHRVNGFWQVLGAAALDWAQSEWQDRRNAGYAADNRSFQERMSNTSYQRAALDLESAGLNRVLALGQGASTPSGAQSSVDKPTAAQTGILASTAKQQIALQKAEEALVGQKRSESISAEDLNKVAAVTSATQGQLNIANANSAAAQARLLDEQAKKTSDEAAKVRAETKKIDMYNPAREMTNDLLEWIETNTRSGARRFKNEIYPTVKKSVQEFLTDDPDAGWWDTRNKGK
ncbi:VP2 [Trichosanthes kirilowii gokushovirus]|nr:VP2 [Trichosanthes kirilowii gokushovirus]